MSDTERKWLAVAPQAFTADGGKYGEVQVGSTLGFHTKQIVILKGNSLLTQHLEVKRVLSDTMLLIGPKGNIQGRTDLTTYTVAASASLEALEQDRPSIDIKEHERAVYAEEPIMAKRVIPVDRFGNYFHTGNPIPVQLSDGSINIGSVNAELEVQLSHKDNDPDSGDVADSVQVGDGVEILQINPDGSINIVSQGVIGQPNIYRQAATITDTSETTVATYAAPASDYRILRVKGDAQTLGTWRMYKNSVAPANLLNVAKTSNQFRDGFIDCRQPEQFTTGDTVIITFEAERYRSEFLGASSTTFVKIEGFTL